MLRGRETGPEGVRTEDEHMEPVGKVKKHEEQFDQKEEEEKVEEDLEEEG